MIVSSSTEEQYLLASHLIDQQKYAEGKQLLETLLENEPRYSPALALLAWLYERQFKAYRKAETLYRLALKRNPEHPSTYLYFIDMLLDLRRLGEAQKLISKARSVPGIERACLDYQAGCILEIRGRYRRAIACYKAARRSSLDTEFMIWVDKAIGRVRRKAGIWSRLW